MVAYRSSESRGSGPVRGGVKSMLARCPECDTLQGATPAEQIKPPWTARYWRIDMHRDPRAPAVCEGSGRKV